MQLLAAAEERIRAFVNQPGMYERRFKAEPDEWARLCVAMDTLGDTASALSHYEASGFGLVTAERYIRLYGVLQAIILQQDAISEIHKIFVGSRHTVNQSSAWDEVRRIRNLAVGHPLGAYSGEGEAKLRVFLSRVSISDRGFKLLTYKGGSLHKVMDVAWPHIYDRYKREAQKLTNAIEDAQARM